MKHIFMPVGIMLVDPKDPAAWHKHRPFYFKLFDAPTAKEIFRGTERRDDLSEVQQEDMARRAG